MMAFRKLDTPSMKACYSAELVFYLEESGKRIDVRCKMYDGIVIYKNEENYAARAGIDDKWLYISGVLGGRV